MIFRFSAMGFAPTFEPSLSGLQALMEIADVIEEVPTVCWCEEEHSATPDMLMAKSSAKAHRSCSVQMKVMWHFAESTTKKENCGSRIVTLTKRLVRANITSVMNDERRKQTEQKLIRSGRCNQHLPAIFPNLWVSAPMRNLSGFWFP